MGIITISGDDMRQLWRWVGHERAVENARVAAVACSRRRLERAEVELFLAGLASLAPPASGRAEPSSQHPA